MKAYIAGKITGDSNYKAKFAAAQAYLERKGFVVLNPASNPEGLTRADYMRIDLPMIDTAEIAYFLRDWHESPGARLEHEFCNYIGKRRAYQDLWEGKGDER